MTDPTLRHDRSTLPRWELHQADALRWLTEYNGEPFDALVTDPPYSSGGAFRGDRTGTTDTKYTRSENRGARPDFEGDNRDQRSFVEWVAVDIDEALDAALAGCRGES